MYLIGIPLNPLTAALSVIIIGICTESMVLLIGRYDEEKGLALIMGRWFIIKVDIKHWCFMVLEEGGDRGEGLPHIKILIQ